MGHTERKSEKVDENTSPATVVLAKQIMREKDAGLEKLRELVRKTDPKLSPPMHVNPERWRNALMGTLDYISVLEAALAGETAKRLSDQASSSNCGPECPCEA